MVWRIAQVDAPIRAIGIVIDIDAGEQLTRHPAEVVLARQPWRQREGRQGRLEAAVPERIKTRGLLVLLPNAAIDDQLGARDDNTRDAERRVDALLIGV